MEFPDTTALLAGDVILTVGCVVSTIKVLFILVTAQLSLLRTAFILISDKPLQFDGKLAGTANW